METLVKCSGVIKGKCKELGCPHFLEHPPISLQSEFNEDVHIVCTAEVECNFLKQIVSCKLIMED